MTWTYSGDPSASNRDAVRFLIGDTVDTSPLLSDEEIAWLLTQHGNIYFAAAGAAEVAASGFSNAAGYGAVKTKTVGSLSISYAEDEARAKEFRTLSKSLKVRGALSGGIIAYSGGISKSDKEALLSDTDWDRPWFSRGMHDNPQAGNNPLLLATT